MLPNPLKKKRTKKKTPFRNQDNAPVYIHTFMFVRVRVPKIEAMRQRCEQRDAPKPLKQR